MMIKDSLLCSVPVVKSFGRKFPSPKMGRKFEAFGGFRRGKILTLTIRPFQEIMHAQWHFRQYNAP